MLTYTSPSFGHNASRPGSHLNKGTLSKIIADILSKGAFNDAEDIIVHCAGTVVTTSGAPAHATYVKDNTVLSGNDIAVCHKVPFGAAQRALQELLNKRDVTHAGWQAMLNFWAILYPSVGWSSAIQADVQNLKMLAHAVYNAAAGSLAEDQAAAACLTAANTFLREFDAADENLYVGFQGTNASISDNIDLHYNILGPTIGPITATPRGLNLMQELNNLETALGLPKTAAVQEVTTANVHWEKNSGAGSSSTIGWVEVF